MAHNLTRSDPVEPPALQARALDNLRFIRSTMERAGAFTAVPGWGNVFMGLIALSAAGFASRQTSIHLWLAVWLGAAFLSFGVALWCMRRKTRAAGLSLFAGPGSRFWLGFCPPLGAGVLLTLGFAYLDLIDVLPPLWLLLYGAGVMSGGAFSVRIVPLVGACFMAVGACALFAPSAWNDSFMAIGFGGLHVIFGFIVVRKYGG